MLFLRRANLDDHEFLVNIDLKNDGYSSTYEMTIEEKNEHSEKIRKYVLDNDKGAWIYEDSVLNKRVGMIMFSIVNRDIVYPWKTIYHELDRTWFQNDGRFMEIFQLWVHPDYRRKGLATKLKLKLEEEAKNHKVNLIYTHTEERNTHVIELNKKIGYQVVRCGPIWDEVIRISLIRRLNSTTH